MGYNDRDHSETLVGKIAKGNACRKKATRNTLYGENLESDSMSTSEDCCAKLEASTDMMEDLADAR